MGFFEPFRLEITDGTTTVDLAHGVDGIYLEEWEPNAPEYKGGGTYQDSPLADGRRLVDRRFGNVTEQMQLVVTATRPDVAIRGLQKLRRLLEKAADYGATGWQNDPVYLVAQGVGETNIRYALISQGRVPNEANPYGAQFSGYMLGRRRSTVPVPLVIEHEIWTETPPTVISEVELSELLLETGDSLLTESSLVLLLSDSLRLFGQSIPLGAWGVFNNRFYGTPGSREVDWLFTWNGAAFSSNLQDATAPFNFFTTGDLTGYILYIGDRKPFYQVTLDIDTALAGAIVGVWEYYDTGAGAWATFGTLTDGTSGLESAVTADVVAANPAWAASVSGDQPTTVNSRCGYWWRFRVTSGTQVAQPVMGARVLRVGDDEAAYTSYLPIVASRHTAANLTDIYVREPGVWGPNLIDYTGEWSLFPANVSELYFGIEAVLASYGPFDNIVFNIQQGGVGYTDGTWEYWDGSAWTPLTVQDNTDGGNGPFTATGVRSVHWQIPTDWALTTLTAAGLGGIGIPTSTAYWVRVYPNALPSAVANQSGRPYIVTWPFVDVGGADVPGDIPALIQMALKNVSATSGFANPNLNTGRVVVGLRGVERGADFSAFLNWSDRQLPSGVSVVGNSGSTIVSRIQSPTGRVLSVTFSGTTTAYLTRGTITLDEGLAQHYTGTFHAYLRVVQSGGAAGDVSLRIEVEMGSDGYDVHLPVAAPESLDTLVTLDMGQVTIQPPVGLQFDSLGFKLTAANSSTSPTLYVYDLVLIPVDECALDLDAGGTINQHLANDEAFVADSIRQKPALNAWAQNEDNQVKNRIARRGSSLAALQANTRQRWWVLGIYGYSDHDYGICHQVEIARNGRYLSMRGDR